MATYPLERLRPLGKALNAEAQDAWYAFGNYDILVLADAPDADAAARLPCVSLPETPSNPSRPPASCRSHKARTQ